VFVCLTETNINHYDGIVSVWLLGKKLGVCIGRLPLCFVIRKIQFILSVPDYSIDNKVDYNIIIDLIVNSKVYKYVIMTTPTSNIVKHGIQHPQQRPICYAAARRLLLSLARKSARLAS